MVAGVRLGVPWPVHTSAAVLCGMAVNTLFNVAAVWMNGFGFRVRMWMVFDVSVYNDDSLLSLHESN